ncbi:cysteine--tRNA ligase [Desulfovibrio psychrotolerans]|uniref:Cysteine--tRNA ligase n=1 Tax=Desulfovibrio psychrotolerans TaxID=415242 RepID=A0A7J0BXE7_9BACT|nr:cysteine--tRNA ligase [Desulfovibrio psychrotolerans]GFM38379.1 cysteine--tRNA ligase [Desulfovibrio psychrotolerans]
MQLYNTLTRKKEEFVPAVPGKVNMYVCGITAYDLCHIGHARSAVVFDVLVRYLRSKGLDVTFARNFTDVDDKIIVRANQEGISSTEVAEKYIRTFYEDMDRLNVLRADIEPRCTEHIGEMIALCEDLIAKGKAYATASGDVYFRVRAFPEYGKLSGRDVDEMRSGARVAPGEEKEDPLDFALWKSAKPGEPHWQSPWGAGRPGWHIECSAMSEKHMPLPLDIHGGGLDLIFPHHENEIAQTEAATDKHMARYWVHNGFVQVDSEKMSKSLGNFKTIRDILERYLPETLRFFLLTKHYRSPIDFSFDVMEEAEKNLKRIYETKALLHEELARDKWTGAELPAEMTEEFDQHVTAWHAAMEDDMNTAGALGHVFGLVRLLNRVAEDKNLRKCQGASALFQKALDEFASWNTVLGLFGTDARAFLDELKLCRAARKGIVPSHVEDLIQQRQEARKAKDFALSDTLRDKLAALGVDVRDTPAGPAWDVL